MKTWNLDIENLTVVIGMNSKIISLLLRKVVVVVVVVVVIVVVVVVIVIIRMLVCMVHIAYYTVRN